MRVSSTLGLEPLVQRLPQAPPAEQVAARLSKEREPFFLDSSARDPTLGRYSFIGCDPFLLMRSRGRSVHVGDATGWREIGTDPFDCLQRLLAQYKVPSGAAPVPFAGGAVGYLGYDLGRLVERLPTLAVDDQPELPESWFGFYDAIVAYDHQDQATYLISTGLPEAAGPHRIDRAQRRLAWLEELALDAAAPAAHGPHFLRGDREASLRSNFTREAYLRAVDHARRYIVAGDIYQVNLSQRFQTPWPDESWDLYSALRRQNPSPFAAYLDLGTQAIISSSPERFLRLSGDTLETRPIKGTRPRGATAALDTELARELVSSAKDQAEHIMIVDLERNDLGRVSRIGSVTVDELMALERYATVFHLTSTVRGKRRADRSLADILRGTFPGGSITGAPKIRAMEIIEELEPTRRGVYTGAIGYFSAAGDFDLNIAIRTIVLNNGVASFQVGGGIVYDSTPEAEYQETLDKGEALVKALGGRWASPQEARHAH